MYVVLQILSELDDKWRTYDVISIVKDGLHAQRRKSNSGLRFHDSHISEDQQIFAYQI